MTYFIKIIRKAFLWWATKDYNGLQNVCSPYVMVSNEIGFYQKIGFYGGLQNFVVLLKTLSGEFLFITVF